MFELHVCQNGEWKRLKTFDARRDAMSASIELELARRFSGVKIIQAGFDSERMATVRRLIHLWSMEDERRAEDSEFEETLERQRQERRRLRLKRQAERERRRKHIQTCLILIGSTLAFLAGAAAWLALLGR